MTATAIDTLMVRGALTPKDAVDWAMRRWADAHIRVLTPRDQVHVREVVPNSRTWKVTATIEIGR